MIWFIGVTKSYPCRQGNKIESGNAFNYVSTASIWEIAVKVSLQKLKINTPFKELNKQLVRNGFELLPVMFEDTLTLTELPFHHRDPFDRMLIARAMNNKLTLISKDEQFSDYEVNVVW